MSARTRFSPLPPRAKGENDPRTREAPKSAWSQQPNDAAWGSHPNELWGVAARDMWKPTRKRGDKARARRRAKRAAKRQGVTLKSYLRAEAKKEKTK